MGESHKGLVKSFLVGALIVAATAAFAQAADTMSAGDFGLVINKKDITSTAAFIPYKAKGLAMEIIAVKASDGTIRTALNTCQVCYRSGRGYYKQVGDVLVCQNCGNRFKIDQVEKVKGGCNPVPILEGDKKDSGDTIGISRKYLESAAPYFAVRRRNS
jgi:hypothetical protein